MAPARSRIATPSAIAARSHRLLSCSGRSTMSPAASKRAADRAQCQRYLRLRRQRGVAAGEDQAQSVVSLGAFRPHVGALQQGEFLAISRVPAQDVDSPPSSRGHEPSARLLRDALFRPLLERGHKAVLDDLLRKVEIAQRAYERRREPAGLLSEDCCDGSVGGAPRFRQSFSWSTTGRTSTMPPPGHVLAMPSASSRSFTSTIAKPPMTSLASMNGPSVTTALPFLMRTVVELLGPWSSAPQVIGPD